MKVALITDQHFCVRDSSDYFIENYRLFYKNIFFPKLIEENIKVIICLGDTFEERKKMNINGLQDAREMYFDIAQKNDIQIITILGNHDVYYKNTNEIHSMDLLEKAYTNIDVIYDTKEITLGNTTFALCSWINKENYKSRLEFIKNTNAQYLLGHFEIQNFEMTRGHACEDGMSQELFKHFKEVWSGHFHIKSKQNNITYLGNPSQTNKGDMGYDRGFHIFDCNTQELQFVKNTYNVYDKILYTEDKDIDFEKYKNKFITVYIKSYLSINEVKFNLFLTELSSYAYNVDVIEQECVISEIDVDSIEYKGNVDLINEYISKIDDNDIDISVLKTYMHELYNESLNTTEDE